MKGPDLTVEISGFKMANPVMLASGILGISVPLLRRVVEAGAGGVVTKSIGYEPRVGYSNPTMVEVSGGYLNAIGLSNPGIKEFYKELSKERVDDLPIVVSLFGAEPWEYEEMIKLLEGLNVKAYELNLSCPHVKGVGMEVGQDPDAVRSIIKVAKAETKKPIFAKLSPSVVDVARMAKVAEEAGADAIVAVNTLKAMAIDIGTGRPLLSNKVGGLSGPAIKPVAVRCVYEIFRAVSIPVIGCGGILKWQDAVEFFLAGATAIQIGTALAHNFLDAFEDITKGIKEYLVQKGKGSVKEIVGFSHDF